LVGIAPYSFVTNQWNEETIDISWNSNIKIVIWSLMMLIIQFVGFLYVISSNFMQTPDTLSDLVARSLQFPLINVTGLLPLALSVSFNPKKTQKIVEKLSPVSKCLFKNKDANYEKHNLRFMIIAIITVIYDTTLHGINIYFCPNGHINYYYGVLIYICNVIWTTNDLQYINVVEVLTQNFILMNEELESIFISRSHSSNKVNIPRPYRTNVFCVSELRKELPNRERIRPVFRTNISHNTSRLAARVLDLRICFNKLYQICRLINSTYGFTLLMEFMTYTICLIGDLYTVCFFLITPYKGLKLISVSRGIAVIMWTIASASKALSVVFASYRANREYRRTVSQIQKLSLCPGLMADTKDQLELFSIQLSNNKILFTACGFFEVDFKLVRTLVYTVTTYVIVLIQVTWFK
jgi:hypothetical protein